MSRTRNHPSSKGRSARCMTVVSMTLALAAAVAEASDVTVHAPRRANDVSIAGKLKQSNDRSMGFWSDSIFARKRHRNALQWSSGSALQISDFDASGGYASLSVDASSTSGSCTAASTVDLDFKIAPLKHRDLTVDYSSIDGDAPGLTVMQQMSEEICWPYDLMSAMTMDIDVDYRFETLVGTMSGEPDPDDSAALKLKAFPKGYGSDVVDWFATHGESEEDVSGGRYKLDAGAYRLEADCRASAPDPVFRAGRNAGGARLDFDLDFSDQGPGNGAWRDWIDRSTFAKVGRLSTGDAALATTLEAQDISASESSTNVHVAARETLDATQSAAWGRHEVVASRSRNSVLRFEGAPVARSVSEFQFSTHLGAELVLLIDGIFAANGRGADAATTIQIFDQHENPDDAGAGRTYRLAPPSTALRPGYGGSYQSDRIVLTVPAYGPDEVGGTVTVRITTEVRASGFWGSEASVDASFMCLIR